MKPFENIKIEKAVGLIGPCCDCGKPGRLYKAGKRHLCSQCYDALEARGQIAKPIGYSFERTVADYNGSPE